MLLIAIWSHFPPWTMNSLQWSFAIVTEGGGVELWTIVGLYNSSNGPASMTVEALDAANSSLGIIENAIIAPGSPTSCTTTAKRTACASPRRSSTPSRANTRNRCGFPNTTPIRDLPGYDDGDFAVQDHSSMLVASALGLQPGMRVLDLCAAPGGKTTHLAELMDNRGRVIACDIDPKRLETVTALCQRLGVKGVETRRAARRTTTRRPGRSTRRWWTCRAATPACSAAGPRCAGGCKPTEFEYLIRLQTRLLIHGRRAGEAGRRGGLLDVQHRAGRERGRGEGRPPRDARRRSSKRSTTRSPAARPTAATGRGCGNP